MKFSLNNALYTALLALIFSGSFACTEPCRVPNPLIQFDVGQDSFAVTPGPIAGADSVWIDVFDAGGDSLARFRGLAGQARHMFFDTSAERPLQLKLSYLRAGNWVAADSLRIDDSHSQGITYPDMDIDMGIVSPSRPCPGTSTNVTVSTTTSGANSLSTFDWAPGDVFIVTMTCSGTTHKYVVEPVAGAGSTGCPHYKLQVFDLGDYTGCTLTDPSFAAVSVKEMALDAIDPDNCSITADDNCGDPPGQRKIKILHPNCTSVTVRK